VDLHKPNANTILSSRGYFNAFGAFQAYYMETLPETQSTISWIGSIQLWMVFFVGTWSGRALDAGLFAPTYLLGVALQILGIFMTSISHTFWQLLLSQGICTGLGSGIFFTPAMGLVTTYFAKKRGIAIAIMSTGGSIGGSVYSVLVRQLLPRIGFGWTIRVLGFVNLVSLSIAFALLKPRLPPRKSGPIVEWSAFKEIPYVCVVAGMSLVFGGLFFSYYYIAAYSRTIIGMTYSDSLTMLIVFNAGGIPFRLVTGHIADRYFGPLNTMVPLIFINSIFAFVWISIDSRTSMYIFATFYGFSGGVFQCLFPTTIASLNTDLSKNGVRLGMALTVISFACLSGPPIGGALLATNGGGRGGYMSAQLGVGLAMALGASLLGVGRVVKYGWSLKIKC